MKTVFLGRNLSVLENKIFSVSPRKSLFVLENVNEVLVNGSLSVLVNESLSVLVNGNLFVLVNGNLSVLVIESLSVLVIESPFVLVNESSFVLVNETLFFLVKESLSVSENENVFVLVKEILFVLVSENLFFLANDSLFFLAMGYVFWETLNVASQVTQTSVWPVAGVVGSEIGVRILISLVNALSGEGKKTFVCEGIWILGEEARNGSSPAREVYETCASWWKVMENWTESGPASPLEIFPDSVASFFDLLSFLQGEETHLCVFPSEIPAPSLFPSICS